VKKIRQFREIEVGEFFVVGIDTSAGGLDYCAAQFLSVDRLDVPLVYHSKLLATEMTPDIVGILEKLFDITGVKPVVAYERNNGGVFEMERLARLNKKQKFKPYQMIQYGRNKDKKTMMKLGWDTNSATRPKMLSDLKEAIDSKLFRVYDTPTIEELFSFVVIQTSGSWRAAAETNAHDDLIMSLAIAWQLYHTETKPESNQKKRIVSLNRFRSKRWAI